MAKKKVAQYKLRDCKDCERAIFENNKIYCPLRLQHKHVLKESGVVVQQNCGYYKGKQ
jgi:hypothetical protein